MKLKSFIITYVLFSIAYIGLIVFTSPHFMKWGEKISFAEKVYAKFLSTPIKWADHLWLIFINSLFWSTIFYFAFISILKLTRLKLRKEK